MTTAHPAPAEFFPALDAHRSLCAHAFLGRVPGVDVATEERAAALGRLDGAHREARHALGLGDYPFVTAQQVHEREVALVNGPLDQPVPGVDGLLTARPGLVLGIYVADCCAVFLLDPLRRAIGLVHSGKKGSALGIVPAGIAAMAENFNTRPEDVIVQLGPCIRPPFYEIDFAAEIRDGCRASGVRPENLHDCGANTAAEPSRYYSYRMEKGRTGRMLALLALVGGAAVPAA